MNNVLTGDIDAIDKLSVVSSSCLTQTSKPKDTKAHMFKRTELAWLGGGGGLYPFHITRLNIILNTLNVCL